MSLQTWKKEFYSPISKVSKKNALHHSLTKWIGLREENLEKHGVEIDGKFGMGPPPPFLVFNNSTLHVDATSCALCRNYEFCKDCPLEDCRIEYGYFTDTLDPEPMITLIQMTIDKDLESK